MRRVQVHESRALARRRAVTMISNEMEIVACYSETLGYFVVRIGREPHKALRDRTTIPRNGDGCGDRNSASTRLKIQYTVMNSDVVYVQEKRRSSQSPRKRGPKPRTTTTDDLGSRDQNTHCVGSRDVLGMARKAEPHIAV